MAINVNAANTQASQMNNDITRLREARRQMVAYRASVSGNWQGKEVGYILTAIDRVVSDIDSAIRNLESLSNDVRTVAAQIKREEEAAAAAAAAARAKAAKEQRIRVAQSAYDAAQKELNDLLEQKANLEARLKRANLFDKLSLLDDVHALEEALEKAQSKCEETYNALRAAKR